MSCACTLISIIGEVKQKEAEGVENQVEKEVRGAENTYEDGTTLYRQRVAFHAADPAPWVGLWRLFAACKAVTTAERHHQAAARVSLLNTPAYNTEA